MSYIQKFIENIGRIRLWDTELRFNKEILPKLFIKIDDFEDF